MDLFLNIVLVLAAYVAHILLSRYLDILGVKGRAKSGNWEGIKNDTSPGLWFLPILGIIFCALFAIVAWYHNWKDTPTGKQFLKGEK